MKLIILIGEKIYEDIIQRVEPFRETFSILLSPLQHKCSVLTLPLHTTQFPFGPHELEKDTIFSYFPSSSVPPMELDHRETT
jgi:hypothetical protein